MIRNARIVLTIFILSISFAVATAQTFDFRKTNWGMSRAAVKASEECKVSKEDAKKIQYDCFLGEEETVVSYTFTGTDKLMRAKYFLTPDYINTIFFIRDFKMYENLLTQKYGTPTTVSPKTINKSAISEDEWAAYLAAGELRVEVIWNTPKTEVMLTLAKIVDHPGIQIDYISKEFSKIDLEEKPKKIKKDL